MSGQKRKASASASKSTVDDGLAVPSPQKRPKAAEPKKKKKAPEEHEVKRSEASERKGAEELVKQLPLLVTGIPPVPNGRRVSIHGIRNVTQGTILELSGAAFRPRKKFLDIVKRFDDLWLLLIAALRKNIPFFSAMTEAKEVETWLYDGAYEKEMQLPTLCENAKGCVLRVVGSAKAEANSLLKVDGDVLSEWCTSFVPLAEIKSGIERANDDAKSLFFLPNYWSLVGQECSVTAVPADFKGFQIVLGTDEMQPYDATVKGTTHLALPGMVIIDPTNGKDSAFRETHVYEKLAEANVFRVKDWLRELGGSWLKSLMQKLIRYQPLQLESPNFVPKTVPADAALVTVMCTLAADRGSLDTRHHRMVSGAEAMFKRLAVIVVEDSFTSNVKDVVFLLCCALIAKQSPQWRPSKELMMRAVRIAVAAMNETRAFAYDIKSERASFASHGIVKGWPLASVLFEEIGGMRGDAAMFRDIASKQRSSVIKPLARPASMPFSHCVDQHCAAFAAYHFPGALGADLAPSKQSTPFDRLFREWFAQVTGVNPRRGQEVRSDSHFVRAVRAAQLRTMALLHAARYSVTAFAPRQNFQGTEGKEFAPVELKRQLCDDWLAAGVGVVKISRSPPVSAIIRPSALHEFVVFRTPSRDAKKSEPLDDDRKEQLRNDFMETLAGGVPWTGCPPPIPEWQGAWIKLECATADASDIKYLVRTSLTDKKFVPWSVARNVTRTFAVFTVNVLKQASADSEKETETYRAAWNAAAQGLWFATPQGVQLGAFEALEKKLKVAEGGVLRRMLVHAGAFPAVFSMPKLSRDGGGSKGTASLDDIGAFQMFVWLAFQFPAALSFTQSIKGDLSFRVNDGPLMWELMDRVRAHISTTASEVKSAASASASARWPILKDTMVINGKLRVPQAHQSEAVENFHLRFQSGIRCHALTRPTGTGKTFITMQYVAEKIARNIMPQYMIYTAPSEAMEAIYKEICAFGATVRILDPSRTSKMRSNAALKDAIAPLTDTVVKPFTVTLVEHDKLRSLTEVMTPQVMAHAVFAVDEWHKTQNSSERTKSAYEMASAAYETIGKSATLVTDGKLQKFVPWASLTARFPVTAQNCMVALGDLDARRVPTGVQVLRETRIAELSKEELAEYRKRMPRGLNGDNAHATHETVHAGQIIATNACLRTMAASAVEMLKDSKCPGVHIVVADGKIGSEVKELLQKTDAKIKALLLGTDVATVNLTASNVSEHADVRIVITPKSRCSGYNLSRYRAQITHVFPSSADMRIQMDGRIDRLGQRANDVLYITVVDSAGLFVRTLKNHEHARNLHEIINEALAAPISMEAETHGANRSK